MANYRAASPTNTFPPQAQGQVIGYARDTKKFKIGKYCQYIEAPDPLGLYYLINPDEAVRIVKEEEFAWEDGSRRPSGNTNLSQFSTAPFRTFRRAITATQGEQTIKNARRAGQLDLEMIEAKSCASKMMTLRTNRVVKMMETDGNWAGNVANAADLNGMGVNWINASSDETNTTNFLAIKKTIYEAVRRINLMTNGEVGPEDLRLVVSPGAAIMMGSTSEVHSYVKYLKSVQVLEEGGLANPNEFWTLPAQLYGIEVVVENAPIVIERPNANGTLTAIAPAGTRQYIKQDSSAILCSRPGGIETVYGSRNFSTVQLFFHEYEATVESRIHPWHKFQETSVVEQFAEILAAPASGFKINNIM
jgi:hypothetical protein